MTAAAIELVFLVIGYTELNTGPDWIAPERWNILAPGTILAFVGLLLGLGGLHVRQEPSPRYGRLGNTGYRLAQAGIALIFLLIIKDVLVFGLNLFLDRVYGLTATTNPLLVGSITVDKLLEFAALLVLSIGFLVWARAALRAKVVPHWFCLLLGGYFFIPLLVSLFAFFVPRWVAPSGGIWESRWALIHGGLGFFCLALAYVLWSTAPPRSRMSSVATTLRAEALGLWNWMGLRNKTLWDWMDLSAKLSIPVVVALVGILFTASQDRQNDEIEEKRAQDEALQGYLNEMSQLVTEGELTDPERNSEESSLARARTLITLRRLNGAEDPQLSPQRGLSIEDREREAEARSLYVSRMESKERKGRIVEFLYQSDLITKGNVHVSLEKADLSFASLGEANLSNADLRGVNFESASLVRANLQGADLRGARLSEASLNGAYIQGADLRDTVGLNPEEIDRTIGDKETKVPGLLPPPPYPPGTTPSRAYEAQLEKWEAQLETWRTNCEKRAYSERRAYSQGLDRRECENL